MEGVLVAIAQMSLEPEGEGHCDGCAYVGHMEEEAKISKVSLQYLLPVSFMLDWAFLGVGFRVSKTYRGVSTT